MVTQSPTLHAAALCAAGSVRGAAKQQKLGALPTNFKPPVPHLKDFFKGQDASSVRRALGVLGQQRTLSAVLPAELRGKVRLVSIDGDCWVLYADNGAVAAKLKQMTLTLAEKLRRSGNNVAQLRIRTAVLAPPQKRPKQAHISSATLEHLRTTIAAMEDSPIRQALIRLVRHHGFD